MANFADADDMIARYDARMLGDLVSDDGTQVPEPMLAANAKMIAALASATGQVKSALLRSERYAVADLEALTGESAALLADITSQIAFWILYRRKPSADPRDPMRTEVKETAEEHLEQLRLGNIALEIATTLDAGLPRAAAATRVEKLDQRLIVDAARPRFYPRRRTYKDR